MKITDKARAKILEALSANPSQKYVRLGLKVAGCAGYEYVWEYESIKKENDVEIEISQVPMLIDQKSYDLLKDNGLEIDYYEDKFASSFKFNNPKSVNECGCGLSFGINNG